MIILANESEFRQLIILLFQEQGIVIDAKQAETVKNAIQTPYGVFLFFLTFRKR